MEKTPEQLAAWFTHEAEMLAKEFTRLDGTNKVEKLGQIKGHMTAARYVCGDEVRDDLKQVISGITGPEYWWETETPPSEDPTA